MELSSVFGGDTLKAADLQGTEPTVTISSVEMKKFDNGNKLVVKFVGKKKALVANKTNSNRIAHAYGTNTDGWIGKDIVLYTDLVDFQGSTVEAIRVRPAKRAAPVRQVAPTTDVMDRDSMDRVPDRVPGSRSTPVDLDDEIPF